ncbi:MAG: hypothetical protein ACRC8W_19265 [Plesiomonas shigelloides]
MRNIDQIKRDMCLCVGAVIADEGWDDDTAMCVMSISEARLVRIKQLRVNQLSVGTLVRAMNALGYTASLTITRGV